MARSMVAEKSGCMLVLRDVTSKSMGDAISKIMKEEVRKEMWDSAVDLHKPNGADQISRFIIENCNIN